MDVAPGVHVLARSVLAEALNALHVADARLVELPLGIATAASFFDAVTQTCPLNPPLQRVTDNWDALSDSMFGGLGDIDEPLAVIAWVDPSTLASADPEASRIALDILSTLPKDLANPEFTAGFPKDLAVLLGAD
jgi:hypothetical protein